MAIVRTVALVANKGVERCWVYEWPAIARST